MPERSKLKKVLIEGTTVVVSILLAFAIDAAWGARTNLLAEEAALDGIRVEFETNLAELDELLAQHSEADTRLEGFYTLPAPGSDDEARKAVGQLVGGLLTGDLFDPSIGTLEMLLNSGKLGLISNRAIRTTLWTWKQQLHDLEDEKINFWENVHHNRKLLGRLGARGIDHSLRPSWQEQFKNLRSSQELSTQARTVLVDRSIYQKELAALKGTTEKLLRLLGGSG